MKPLPNILENWRAKLPRDRESWRAAGASARNVEQWKRRLQPRTALALTLFADRIEVSHVRLHLEDDGVDVIPGRAVPIGAEDVCRNPEKVGGILATALESAGWKDKRCAVAVPPAWALTASTDLPAAEPDDLRGYLELRAEREFPVAISELRLAHSPYTLPDGTRRATLAALPARRVDAINTMLAAAGNRRAISISLALGDTLAEARNDPAPTLYILASPGHTDVVVTAGGGVAALRSLSGPGRLEDKRDDGFGAVPSETPPETFDPAAFTRDLRITLGRLPQGITPALNHAHFGGDTATAAELRRAIRDSLWRMGIEAIEDEPAPGSDVTAEQAAAASLRRREVPFEFVIFQPHRVEALYKEYNTPQYRKIALIVAAVILLPALLFFVRGRYEDHLNAEWNGMRDNVAELDGLQQKIRRLRPWFDSSPVTDATLERVFAAFPEGGDVWAKSIQINGGLITCTGFAKNQGALLEFTRKLGDKKTGFSGVALKNQRGENPIQFTVTCQGGGAS